MTEKHELFVERLGHIHFWGGMVRYDMVILESSEDGREPVMGEKVRLVISRDGFLKTFDSMQRLMDQFLEEALQRR